MADVFISYSRLDKEFVGQLREALIAQAQEVWIDWESIPPSQAWWNEIQKGIARANNFVVVLSPASMASPICQMEIEYACQLKKRIIPVLHADYDRSTAITSIAERLAKLSETSTREIWGSRQPHDVFDSNETELKHINYFFFKAEDDFPTRFADLFAIIRTDYRHKEQHTTLELRAMEWDRRGRDASFLLIENE
ncbi:MAG: toll/interleukin-1 receptor domain-containing protein, partial [Anaerolineae bacterium]|nr:toll/interleukin-1 receptor domain-containing protein [Anaerolineae bacterium]